jgi:stage V sporulation protein B
MSNAATAARSFAVSVAALAAVRLIGVLSGFAVTVIGARLLSQADLGAAGVAITIGTVAALACNGGVNIATIYLGGRLPERRVAVLGATTVIALAGFVGSIALVTLSALVLAGPLGVDGRDWLFAGAAVVAAGIIGYEYGGAVLLAIGRQREFALMELIRGLVTLGCVAVLLVIWPTDAAFVLGTGIGYVAGSAMSFGIGQARTGALRPAWNSELVRWSLAIGLRGQAGNILQFLNLRLDLLLVPVLLQLSSAGLYVVAVRVSEVLTQVASSAGSLIFPAVAGGTDPGATELTERTVRVSLLVVAVAAVALIALADPLLAVAFGAAYESGATTLRILAVAMLPLSLSRILAGDLKGRGRPGSVSVAMLVAVAATLVLDVVLIPRLGITGAGLASLVAYSASAAMLVALFLSVTGARIGNLIPNASDLRLLLRAASALRGAAR